jgi:hypothetical protein
MSGDFNFDSYLFNIVMGSNQQSKIQSSHNSDIMG